MKNLLSENMLRFGTKNLSEAAQRELVLKSIMETINEHGLHNAVKRQLGVTSMHEAVTGQPDASLTAPSGGPTVAARTLCDGDDYFLASFKVYNASMQEAYIKDVTLDVSGNEGDSARDGIWRFFGIEAFNTVDAKNKPVVGQAEQKNYSAVKKASTVTVNVVIKTYGNNAGYGWKTDTVQKIKKGNITITYNGIDLVVPITFQGLRVDNTGSTPCDAPIALSKGF